MTNLENKQTQPICTAFSNIHHKTAGLWSDCYIEMKPITHVVMLLY